MRDVMTDDGRRNTHGHLRAGCSRCARCLLGPSRSRVTKPSAGVRIDALIGRQSALSGGRAILIRLVAVAFCSLSAAPVPGPPASESGRHDAIRAGSTSTTRPGGVTELRGQQGASINELGIQQSFDLSWRRALSASPQIRCCPGAHVAVGGSTAFTPAHVRGGGVGRGAPLSIFVIRVEARSPPTTRHVRFADELRQPP